jgi:hypothetical protein
MESLINANYGVVRSVSNNRERIKIVAPRGGIFECQNAGFEIGQAVCFILDTLGRQILKVLPKEIADLQLMAGLNPELQEAMQDKPINGDADVEDDIALMEEMTNANNGTISQGYSSEEYIDIVSRMDGECPFGGDDNDRPEDQE